MLYFLKFLSGKAIYKNITNFNHKMIRQGVNIKSIFQSYVWKEELCNTIQSSETQVLSGTVCSIETKLAASLRKTAGSKRRSGSRCQVLESSCQMSCLQVPSSSIRKNKLWIDFYTSNDAFRGFLGISYLQNKWS